MNKNNKLASPSPSRFGSYRRDKSNEGFHEDLDLRFEPWVGWDRWSSSKNLGRWISSTSKPYEPSNDHKSLTSFKSSISSLLMITTHPKSNQREREKPIHSFEPSNEHSKLLPPTSLPKKKKKPPSVRSLKINKMVILDTLHSEIFKPIVVQVEEGFETAKSRSPNLWRFTTSI